MGLRSSCPASRLLMDFWADTVKDIEEKMEVLHQLNPVQFESIKTHLLIKYVDDVLTVINRIKPGVIWNHISGSLNWSPEAEMEDKQKTPEEHTMEVFADLAGGVLKCLEFTWDCPSKNMSHKMPVLDTQMWIGYPQRQWGVPGAALEDGTNLPRAV